MSTILPPAASGPAIPAPSATPVVTVAGGGAAAEVAALPTGAVLEAVVLPQQGQGRNLLEVVTSGGALILRIRDGLQLPGGANLILQVASSGGQTALRLAAVNGRMLTPGILPGTTAAAGQPAAALPELAATLPNLTPGGLPPSAGLTATLLRSAVAAGQPADPAATAALPAGLGPDLPTGTRLTLRIAGITMPELPTAAVTATTPTTGPTTGLATAPTTTAPTAEAAPTPSAPTIPTTSDATATPTDTAAPTTPPTSAPSTAAPATAPPTASAPATTPSSVPTGTTPTTVPAPPPAATAPTAEPASTALPGTVLDQSPGGPTLVQTPIGTLSLPSAGPLPPGAALDLRVVGPPLPPLPSLAPAAPTPTPLSQDWPAMTDALQTLAANADAGAAIEQLARTLPQLNPQLAANLSVFASALKAGDDRPLLGDSVVRGLEKAGRRDLAGRLKADFHLLSQKAATPLGANGEWRGFALPLILGVEVAPVHLYVHQPPPDSDGEAGGGRRGDEHRFLVEVNLSRLGRMQFDGLVQREAKRFDLIIRTAEPMSEEMRRDIQGLFLLTSEAVGTKGGVVFQAGGRFLDLPPAPVGATRLTV